MSSNMAWSDFSRYLSEDLLETTIRRTEEKDPTVGNCLVIQLASYQETYGEDYMVVRENRTDQEVRELHEKADTYKHGCASTMFDKLQNM